jgi:hypothetical protein
MISVPRGATHEDCSVSRGCRYRSLISDGLPVAQLGDWACKRPGSRMNWKSSAAVLGLLVAPMQSDALLLSPKPSPINFALLYSTVHLAGPPHLRPVYNLFLRTLKG